MTLFGQMYCFMASVYLGSSLIKFGRDVIVNVASMCLLVCLECSRQNSECIICKKKNLFRNIKLCQQKTKTFKNMFVHDLFLNEWINKQWTNKWMNKQMKKKWMNEQTFELMNAWINEQKHERMNERRSKRKN